MIVTQYEDIFAEGRRVKVGVVGTGARGTELVKLFTAMPDVEVAALCDTDEHRLLKAVGVVKDATGTLPHVYIDYRDLTSCASSIDVVVIATDWPSHVDIAVSAMSNGIMPALEVGGASSLEECWRLVRTSESTGVPCAMLENCCFGQRELALLNMVRRGVFGDVIFCAGGYQHDLRQLVGDETNFRNAHWRRRNGELYPTHELGPIAQYLNINHGNRMETLTAMATRAAGEADWLKSKSDGEGTADASYRQGDVVTTLIKCAGGEVIRLTFCCTLARPYSRGGVIQGTRGIWQEDGSLIFIEGGAADTFNGGGESDKWQSDERLLAEYEHPLWREYTRRGTLGSHGGMDYLVLRDLIHNFQIGAAPTIDVYDAAAWMSVTCLSEKSIARGSMPVDVPDFTGGKWLGR